MSFAQSRESGSDEAKNAYCDLDELSSALFNLVNARRPKMVTDMDKVVEEIKLYAQENP